MKLESRLIAVFIYIYEFLNDTFLEICFQTLLINSSISKDDSDVQIKKTGLY